jgi:putative oxidoreductase
MRCFCAEFSNSREKDPMRILNSLEPLALLLLRAGLGVIFIAHGYPLLAHRTSGTHALYLQHGLPSYFVYVTGVLEVFGGGLLLIGLFTRAAGLLLAIETAFLLANVYAPHSYLAVNEYAYPMVVATSCFALATLGAGIVSLDSVLFGSGASKSKPRK